jgi:hypothetical protein
VIIPSSSGPQSNKSGPKILAPRESPVPSTPSSQSDKKWEEKTLRIHIKPKKRRPPYKLSAANETWLDYTYDKICHGCRSKNSKKWPKLKCSGE